jgi:hypothetical protein
MNRVCQDQGTKCNENFHERFEASIACNDHGITVFAWQGLYKGHHGYCSAVLEAMADYDMSIWHSFFGMDGSHNEINVMH